MLIRLAKKARHGGGEAALCNLSDNMKQMMKTLMLLENTKTDFFWVPFETRELALQSLAGKSKESSPVSDAQQNVVPKSTPPQPDPPSEDAGGGWSRFVK